MNNTTLYVPIKREWFLIIKSGIKTEEYREITPYWKARIEKNRKTHICLRNGYSSKSPSLTYEIESITTGIGRKEWGAPDHPVYIIKLKTTP